MIIDSHLHVGTYPLRDAGLDPGGLAVLMRVRQMSRALVSAPHNDLARAAADQVEGVAAAFWADPSRPGCQDRVAAGLGDSRFRAVKLHPVVDGYDLAEPAVGPVLELAAERNVPVLVHAGHPAMTGPAGLEALAVRFPHVSLVLGHAGGNGREAAEALIAVAARHPRIYLDTAALPSPAVVAAAARAAPGRVLFGSDAPFARVTAQLRKVRLSGLNDGQLRDVLHDSAARLFFGES